MYLINYDFYDLYSLIVFFRCKPERFSDYRYAVKDILNEILTSEKSYKNNIIRNILKPHYNENDELISWVTVENRYTANIKIMKNKSFYLIISAILNEMIGCCNDSERFYCLCDATHNVPLVLVDEVKPKRIIINMIKEYRKSYNSLFLKEELKRL